MINAFQWYFYPSTLRPNTEHVHDVIFTWHFVQRLVHGVMSSRATLHSESVRISISTLARSIVIVILHSLICRVLLLLLLLRHASDLRNCTSYFGACMWVWYCRPPIGAQPPPVPQQLGENPKNWALNRQFPAKMMKHETPSISESTKPIEMKI